jgi:hypothetical protein
MRPALGALALAFVSTASLVACGARSGLPGLDAAPVASGTGGAGAGGGAGGASGCIEGAVESCGSDVGVCVSGTRTCVDGQLGACVGAVGPTPELCNGLDDNCDGAVDEGFGLGQACDGPDSDLCADDVMTCDGCSLGPDIPETCNGLDDNCNGIIDADCDLGDCQPKLVVTGSVASSPGCIDFPVEAGSTGIIQYPCGGGSVTATLGSISFTGSVTNGVVSLSGTATVVGPDTCLWQTTHTIGGTLSSGALEYAYEEQAIDSPEGVPCWNPCTEFGTVTVSWK